MARKWIKVFCEEFLQLNRELSIPARAVYASLLALAGLRPYEREGIIEISEGVGYSSAQLSKLLNIQIEILNDVLKELEEKGMIRSQVNQDEVIIEVLNWRQFQSDYSRVRESQLRYYRKVSNEISNKISNETSNEISNKVSNEISNKVSNEISNKVSNKISNSIEVEIEKEVEKEIEKEKEVEKEKENKVIFDDKKMMFIIPQPILEKFVETFGEDLVRENIKLAESWVMSQPRSRWKKDWKRFLYNWFSKAYERRLARLPSKELSSRDTQIDALEPALRAKSIDAFVRVLFQLTNAGSFGDIPGIRSLIMKWKQQHGFLEDCDTIYRMCVSRYKKLVQEKEVEAFRKLRSDVDSP